MKEVNYREDDWREAKSALAPFAAANWVGGLFNNLEKVSKNMEEAEEDIQELDSDHAISFQHTNYRGKYSAIEDDLMVLYKFSCHAGEKMETLVDQPFYEKLDAFVDGMQDLSISTYSTTNRIGAKSKQTYTTTSGGSQVIESIKEGATIEDLMNGDNFYANQMQLQYRDWQRANPDQDVSKKDFQMGMLHSRAFEYKSIKDEQQEKEFWVSIVATVVIVGVSIFCPPAGLALAVGYGSLEAGSAISGKDWVSGRELSTEERALRGGLALLDIVPGVKALSTGAKAASAGSKLVRVGDNILVGSKNVGKGTIDNGIQAGKQAMDLRLANAKKVSEAVQKKLTKDLDDISTMAKTIQNKTKETFTLPPREQIAFAGGGSIPEQSAAGAASIAAKKKLKDIMQNMDNLNVKGGGESGTIEKIGKTNELKSPSSIARSWQGGGKYPGVDDYEDIVLKVGDVIYRGEPNGSEYFTTKEVIENADISATKIFEGLQVEKHPIYGYRKSMTGYKVNSEVDAASGFTKANPQFGEGGALQVFVPNVNELIEKGILIPIDEIKLID
ncbi:TPA: ribonuclease YeeF family protein [Listeria innocua]